MGYIITIKYTIILTTMVQLESCRKNQIILNAHVDIYNTRYFTISVNGIVNVVVRVTRYTRDSRKKIRDQLIIQSKVIKNKL